MTISFRDPSTMFGTTAESRLFAGICAVLTVFFVGFFTAGLFLGHRQFNTEISVVTGAVPAEGSALGLDDSAARELLVASHAASSEPAAPISAAVLAVHEAPVSAGALVPEALNRPAVPSGSTVVQVAALLSHERAEELAQTLQQKHFAAFVRNAGADNFNRVQIGPFADLASARTARQQLAEMGYATILKRR